MQSNNHRETTTLNAGSKFIAALEGICQRVATHAIRIRIRSRIACRLAIKQLTKCTQIRKATGNNNNTFSSMRATGAAKGAGFVCWPAYVAAAAAASQLTFRLRPNNKQNCCKRQLTVQFNRSMTYLFFCPVSAASSVFFWRRLLLRAGSPGHYVGHGSQKQVI